MSISLTNHLKLPTELLSMSNDLAIQTELNLIDTVKKRKLFVRYIEENKILVGINLTKSIFIFSKGSPGITDLLSGYIITKNAGFLGVVLNRLLIILIKFLSVLPASLFKQTKIRSKYNIITWRKGSRYRFVSIDSESILDFAKKKSSIAIRREIEARLEHSDDISIPKLLAYGENFNFFEQELIRGKSLLTLNPKEIDRNEVLVDVFGQLVKIYEKSLVKVHFSEYLAQLTETILGTKLISLKNKDKIKSAADMLKYEDGSTLFLCNVHGDFNLGNIVVADHQNYILDWERSGTCSAAHDYFNLFWFLEHIHSSNGFDLSRIENKPFFSKILKLSHPSNFQHYEFVYFLERVIMWITYPHSNQKWLDTLLKIMDIKIKTYDY